MLHSCKLMIKTGRKGQITEEKKYNIWELLQQLQNISFLNLIHSKFYFLYPQMVLSCGSELLSVVLISFIILCVSGKSIIYQMPCCHHLQSPAALQVVEVPYYYFLSYLKQFHNIYYRGIIPLPGKKNCSVLPDQYHFISFSIYSHLSSLFDQQFIHLLYALWYELGIAS